MDPQTPQHNSRKACNIETNTADRTINTTDSHSDFGVDHPASLAFKRRSNGIEHVPAIVSVLLIKILFQLNSWPPY